MWDFTHTSNPTLNKEIKYIMMFIMKIQRQLDLSINSENEDSLGKGKLIK